MNRELWHPLPMLGRPWPGDEVREARHDDSCGCYSDDQERRLEIIQGLKTLGFELERIRELFSLKDRVETGGDLARAMTEVLVGHQAEIDRKISHYEEM